MSTDQERMETIDRLAVAASHDSTVAAYIIAWLAWGIADEHLLHLEQNVAIIRPDAIPAAIATFA